MQSNEPFYVRIFANTHTFTFTIGSIQVVKQSHNNFVFLISTFHGYPSPLIRGNLGRYLLSLL